MNRLIVVTFAFMGWAFWVLSGGAEFEPERREPPPQAPAEAATPTPEAAAEPAAEVATAPSPAPDPEPVAEPAVSALVAVAPTLTDETGVQFRSLADPATATVVGVPRPDAISADMRVVSAARVNLREGPSTAFAIILMLDGGASAEVLEETASGWARVRLPDTGIEGWVSLRMLAAP